MTNPTLRIRPAAGASVNGPGPAPVKVPPAKAIADALVAAGVLNSSQIATAVAVITANLPRQAAGPYNFSADAEFLHSSLRHHVDTYFAQVMRPNAMIHHAGGRAAGRLIKDREIDDATVELTTQTIAELGADYRRHLDRYFNDDAGLTAYVFNRIHDELFTHAIKFNDEYLMAMSRRENARRIAEV